MENILLFWEFYSMLLCVCVTGPSAEQAHDPVRMYTLHCGERALPTHEAAGQLGTSTSVNLLLPSVHPPGFSVVFCAFQVELGVLGKARAGGQVQAPKRTTSQPNLHTLLLTEAVIHGLGSRTDAVCVGGDASVNNLKGRGYQETPRGEWASETGKERST